MFFLSVSQWLPNTILDYRSNLFQVCLKFLQLNFNEAVFWWQQKQEILVNHECICIHPVALCVLLGTLEMSKNYSLEPMIYELFKTRHFDCYTAFILSGIQNTWRQTRAGTQKLNRAKYVKIHARPTWKRKDWGRQNKTYYKYACVSSLIMSNQIIVCKWGGSLVLGSGDVADF